MIMDERTSRKHLCKAMLSYINIRQEKKVFGQEEGLERPTKGIKDDMHIYSFNYFIHLFSFAYLPT